MRADQCLRTATISALPLICLLGCSSSGSGTSASQGGGSNNPPPPSPSAVVKIVASNDLGMHCVDADFSVFSILPPYNVVHAQVIATDATGNPAVLSDSQITLGYSPVADASGSINTHSVGKTNFWQYAKQIYGATLAPGEGLKGLYMPGDATSPAQTAFTWSGGDGVFKAEGVPIFPLDDAGQINRYPLMRLTATDKSTGQPLASLDVVLPVSEETTCSDCHATGGAATRAPGITWSTAANLEVQTRENVLLLHDARVGTTLMAAKPVLCAGCHYSAALDLAGTGPAGNQVGHPTMSAAMHAYHADKMLASDGTALTDRWVTQGGPLPTPTQQACYACHPGRTTQCLRGAMTDALTCQNCHGDMKAVGGTSSLRAGGSIDGRNDGHPRRPWRDLPRCQSCHTGDAASHLTLVDASLMATDGIRTLVAFDTTDPAASARYAPGSHFAENTSTLYRFSKGHAGILCEGCHNSTHAIWPNPIDAHNDNVASRSLQGHTGTIVECSACHTPGTLPLSLGGPHGMHPVGDLRWAQGGHGDLADNSSSACAACHGTDFRGTALSKTATLRTWSTLGTFPKGRAVGCYDCHNGPGGT